MNTEGDPGLELLSETVAVDRDTGICEPRVLESVGAEPFVARVRYTGNTRRLVMGGHSSLTQLNSHSRNTNLS